MKREANNAEKKDNWKIKLKKDAWERVCEITMPFAAPFQFVAKALEDHGYSIIDDNPSTPAAVRMSIQFGR